MEVECFTQLFKSVESTPRFLSSKSSTLSQTHVVDNDATSPLVLTKHYQRTITLEKFIITNIRHSSPSDSMIMQGRLLNPKGKKNVVIQVSIPAKNIQNYKIQMRLSGLIKRTGLV